MLESFNKEKDDSVETLSVPMTLGMVLRFTSSNYPITYMRRRGGCIASEELIGGRRRALREVTLGL